MVPAPKGAEQRAVRRGGARDGERRSSRVAITPSPETPGEGAGRPEEDSASGKETELPCIREVSLVYVFV